MAGSIMDVIDNPLARAAGNAQMGTDYFPPAPQPGPPSRAPMAAPAQASSRIPQYNPLTDPEGPLAQAGWIGALLFGHGTSKTEYVTALEQERQRQVGMARGKAFQTLSQYMQQGMTPQQAYLAFLNTPEGMDYIVQDDNPQEAVQQFMQLTTVDPKVAARQQAFGGVDAGGGTPGAQAPQQPQMVAHPAGGQAPATENDAALQQQIAAGEEIILPAGTTPEKLLKAAQDLAAIGDDEGAGVAIRMAEQYQKMLEGPGSTDELREYNRYVAQERKAGREPMDWLAYKKELLASGKAKMTLTPDEERQKAKHEARLRMDEKAYQDVAESASALGRAMPVLQEIERISSKVPGGYKGALIPYINRIATSMGFPVSETASDAEALSALTQQLLPLVRQPGQVSNYEQQQYVAALPGLIQSPEGRAKILSVLKRMAERTQAMQKIYRQYAGEDELVDKLAELDAKPILSPDERNEFERLANERAAAESKNVPGRSLTDDNPLPKDKQGQNPKTGELAVGTVMQAKDGKNYRFKGGNRYDRNNWEPVERKSETSKAGGGGF